MLPVFRYRLLALLILTAVLVALVFTGVLGFNRRGVGRAIRDVKRLAPEIEKHNQEVRELATP